MNQQSKRLFIALPFQHQAVASLDEVQKILQGGAMMLKVVPSARYHLTMKFLGDVPGDKAEKMAEDFHGLGHDAEAPAFSLRGLGAFPSLKRARVLWVGIRENDRHLNSLYHVVEDFCATFGFDREKRPFKPHLTLARVKRDRSLPADVQEYFEAHADTHYADSFFDKLILYSSTLRPRGPLYNEIATINFNQE